MVSAVPDGPSDAGLVHAALGGDVASFSALLDWYRASLYAQALVYLGRPEEAADAVQETFLLATPTRRSLSCAACRSARCEAACTVLRTGPLPQRLQYGGQRRGASRGEVTGQAARAAKRQPRPQRPVGEAVIRAITRAVAMTPLVHLPGEARQPSQVRAAAGGSGQDLVRIALLCPGQPVGPAADLSRPGFGELPRGHRIPDHRVGGQPTRPADRPGGGTGGDAGLPLQPGAGTAVPVVLIPRLSREGGQYPAPGSGVLRPGPLQRA
jgi:hypothetical protein